MLLRFCIIYLSAIFAKIGTRGISVFWRREILPAQVTSRITNIGLGKRGGGGTGNLLKIRQKELSRHQKAKLVRVLQNLLLCSTGSKSGH